MAVSFVVVTTPDDPLYWDASYAVALRLQQAHPGADLEGVSLEMIYNWVLELPGFADEPELANDELLTAIYQDWYEAAGEND